MTRATTVLAAALVIAACSSTSNPTPGESTPGVVPADLRDVERDGEGLVSTTFGAYPDRKPDWARAASVLALLEDVWGKSKQKTPGLPAAQVKAVDDAIATLHTAIPGQDQESAAFASNAVGLAVPELFDFFHPDAPIGVVRLDAYFRQVGLDGHYGKSDEAKKDLAQLHTDWDATKATVVAKVPTCHRVGGTATVGGDVDTSLANLDKAVAASDKTTIEQESENGALEIDTLELLFDCPPDNATPDHGLGAKCSSETDCAQGQSCDRANSGGKCAPSVSNKIGTPCTTTNDCGSDARAACNTEAGDAYPGGYCFMEPCNDIETCPPGATCVAIGGESPGCYKTCTADAECRTAEGYVCQLFLTTPPTGFGPSDHACAFPCTRDDDCQKPLTCDVATKKCKP
jgi:hypothetical protein